MVDKKKRSKNEEIVDVYAFIQNLYHWYSRDFYSSYNGFTEIPRQEIEDIFKDKTVKFGGWLVNSNGDITGTDYDYYLDHTTLKNKDLHFIPRNIENGIELRRFVDAISTASSRCKSNKELWLRRKIGCNAVDYKIK